MKRLVILGALPAVTTAALAYAIYVFWRSAFPTTPALEYPTQLELGRRELGELVEQPVVFKNVGSRDLVIDEIGTNCSCSGLESKVSGRFARFESLIIRPGERVQLWVRISVRGVPIGQKMLTTIAFRSNDPVHPSGRIEAVVGPVSGGVQFRPDPVVFGSVPVGAEVRRIVEVFDDALEERVIQKVRSLRPERIAVRSMHLDQANALATSTAGKVIGRFEVTIDTTKPGDIDSAIELELADRTAQTLGVTGRVTAAVEVTPSPVVLPRNSLSGPIYETTCVCRSSVGSLLALDVVDIPNGLTLQLLDGNEESVKLVLWHS